MWVEAGDWGKKIEWASHTKLYKERSVRPIFEHILSLLHGEDTFKDFELKLEDSWREKLSKNVVKVLEAFDEELMKIRNKDRLKVQGIRKRTFVTVFGEITYERRYYYDKKRDEYRYLVDEEINLPKYARVSNGIKMKALKMVRDLSYRKSAEKINDMTGGYISASSLHRWVQELGEKKEKELKRKRKKAFVDGLMPEKREDADKTDHLFIEADGVVIRLQNDEEGSSFYEIKLGVTYTGWETRFLNSQEYRVKNKKIFGGCADSEKFWQEVALNIRQRYILGSDGMTVLNGDGAGWVGRAKTYLPSLNYRMLDSYHLQRKLLRGLGRSEFLPKVRKAIAEYDKEKTVKLLDKAKSYRRTQKDKEKVKELKNYILEHWENIPDYREKDISTPEVARGMGVIESNVDYILADRLKKQGISWSKEGAKNISRVIIAYENDELEKLLLKEEQEIKEDGVSHKRAYRRLKRNQKPSEEQFFKMTSEPAEGAAYRFLKEICRNVGESVL